MSSIPRFLCNHPKYIRRILSRIMENFHVLIYVFRSFAPKGAFNLSYFVANPGGRAL